MLVLPPVAAVLALSLSALGLASNPIPLDAFPRAVPRGVFAERSTSKCTVNETYPTPSLPSLYDLLKRDAFVTRKGSELFLLNKPFRVVGPNIYWLGLDENVGIAYPSKSRVLDAMAAVSAMRSTVIRAHTLGVSVGNPLSVEPALDVWNEDAYESIDFAVLAARVYGLKLMIPLTDNSVVDFWLAHVALTSFVLHSYHGGKYQFIQWHGHTFSGTGANITPEDVGAYFFNTTAIVNSFKRFINHHLNHVNRYTGIALKDDPTIIGWETGNELSAMRFGDGPAPPNWTRDIARLIKRLAPKHLVFDGTYPLNTTKFHDGLAQAEAVDRVYVVGEFDWRGTSGTDMETFFRDLEARRGATGTLFWSLFGHSDDCCSYVEHDDGLSFYYDRDDFYRTQGDILTAHAERLNRGRVTPEILPQVACPSRGAGGAVEQLLERFLPLTGNRGAAAAALKSAMSTV
ncbi:glycoside hydrolase [Auricularia subglabra TFB-10046 SS5]|uniref:mannan endo-1,4-beta-mannosidase n=1 Tax=Auricularia subglabra (strain TFB-10046 / SS5) TaxID=717982 RepID=J0DBV6_AURST|nr:glycoside hydrolase [Auricularia subglabra TFB-10046 SS5]